MCRQDYYLSHKNRILRIIVQDYSDQIELVRTNFPEIYELYCRESVVIDDVYTYVKDGRERVGINYHYR